MKPRLSEELKRLYPDDADKLKSPRPVLKNLGERVDQPLPETHGDRRRELMGIAAYFIGKAWRNAQSIIAKHPPGGSEISIADDGDIQREGDVNPRDVGPMLGITPAETNIVITRWMKNTLALGMRTVGIELEKDAESPIPGFDVKAYRRYERLLREVVKHHTSPTRHMSQGINVGLRVVGSYFSHVHRAYQKRTGKQITANQAIEILLRSRHSIHLIAGMFVNTLNEMEHYMDDPAYNFALYDDDSIVLVGEGDSLVLEPHPDALESLTAHSLEGTTRTGCPALIAKGSDGKSVIDGIFDWYMQMAEAYYFPNLEMYIENEQLRAKVGI